MSITYYHNPKCSKSRAGLELLKARGTQFHLRLYLEDPLSPEELQLIVKQLHIKPWQLARISEAQQAGIKASMDDRMILDLLSQNPKAIERPICTAGDQGVIGRPPQKIMDFLEEIDED